MGAQPARALRDHGEGPVAAVLLAAILLVGAAPNAGAAPAVHLSARDARILYYGDVEVEVASADGAPHRVRIQVQAPAGLQAPDPAEVSVPAAGRATASVRLWRSSATRGTRVPVVVAAAIDGAAEPAASVSAVAQILPDPAWMPRLRRPLAALALLLMAAAALLETRQR